MPSYSNIVSAPLAAANVAGATKLYATPDLLPQSGVAIGDIAYVISSKKLMVWNSGWYSIAIVNSDPLISTNLDPFTSFETDGTPIVLTLVATDPEGIPLVWSYAITSGSLGTTATVTQVDNEFTITPSTDPVNEGEFEITFSVTDGVATSTVASTFRLLFNSNWRYGSIPPTTYTDNIGLGTGSGYGSASCTDGIHIILGAQASSGNAGKAYILDTSGNILRELISPSSASNYYFGCSVGISGDYCVVGQYGYNNSQGRAYIYEVSTGNLVHTLDNPNAYASTTTNDLFGYSVSMDGDVLAVGAFGEDDPSNSASTSGRVYVFSVSSGQLVHTLDNPNIASTTTSDNFGRDVRVRGDYVVSASYEDTLFTDAGAVYVFNATSGQLLYSLTPPVGYQQATTLFGIGFDLDPTTDRLVCSNEYGNNFIHVYELSTGTLLRTLPRPPEMNLATYWGRSLSISGYTIVVTDPATALDSPVFIYHSEVDDVNNMSDGRYRLYSVSGTNSFLNNQTVGRVFIRNGVLLISQYSISYPRVYIHKDVGILKSSYILNPNPYSTANGDMFGIELAISGTTLLVSATWEDDASGTASGKVYVYDITTKTLLRTIDNPNSAGTSASDFFGGSIGLSGDYAIIATNYEDPGGISDSGTVYIYNVATGALLHTIPNPEPSPNATARFGISVSISGNYAAVGSQLNDEDGPNSGMAYIYNVTTGELVHTLHNPNAYNTPDNDNFGIEVCIKGNLLAVGASGEDDVSGTESGKVYIFDVVSGDLLRTISNPNAFGTSASDNFGRNIAISGKYIIITSQYEDESGYTDSGKAYVFNVNTGALLYTFNNPNIYSTPTSDYYGSYISADGDYVVISAHAEDGPSGLGSGTFYIYDLRDGSLIAKVMNPTGMNTNEGQFGLAVALSGKYLASGHNGYEFLTSGQNQSGYVRVWEASA